MIVLWAYATMPGLPGLSFYVFIVLLGFRFRALFMLGKPMIPEPYFRGPIFLFISNVVEETEV